MASELTDFDVSELTEFEKEILGIANNDMPKETKKFLRKQGNKLKKKTLNKAKAEVKVGERKDATKYHKSIKRGKVYKYDGNGGLSVRVYSNAPHAHLLEYGHRQVVNPPKPKGRGVIPGKGIGKEVGFVEGCYVFEKTAKEFELEHYNDTERFIDDVLDKGLA